MLTEAIHPQLKEFWLEVLNALEATAHKAEGRTPLQELCLAFHNEDPDRYMTRFLRARQSDVQAAVAMATASIAWRMEFGVFDLLKAGEDGIVPEPSGFIRSEFYLSGYDKHGRLVSYVHVGLHDPKTLEPHSAQLQTVYMLELGSLVKAKREELGTIVFDLRGFSMANMNWSGLKFLVKNSQDNYPERLGLCLIVGAPWVFQGVWKLIKALLDPVVASKIQFVNCENISDFIEPDQLVKRCGGQVPDFEYLPVTEETRKRFADFQEDTAGKEAAWSTYNKASEKFIAETRKWCADEQNDRAAAVTELEAAYVSLVPYIRPASLYHRNGLLTEPQILK